MEQSTYSYSSVLALSETPWCRHFCLLVTAPISPLDRATMSGEDTEAMAKRLGLRLYRSCVKEDVNVEAGDQLPAFQIGP